VRKAFTLFFILSAGWLSNALASSLLNDAALQKMLLDEHIPEYHFQVIHTHPHDTHNFTEGLYFQNGLIYESTGLYGQSQLRMSELNTGKILKQYSLPQNFFGEGMTMLGNQIYQLTWREHAGLIYDPQTLIPQNQFSFAGEGWGLTARGNLLIMSNGSDVLSFIDPVHLKLTLTLKVRAGSKTIPYINELEYIDGMIYANVWPTSIILLISPENGKVQGWFSIQSLKPEHACLDCTANGIAYNEQDKVIYVTGKNWPVLYGIKLQI